jgi:chitodextrinase
MKLFKHAMFVLIIGTAATEALPVSAQTHWFSASLSGANEIGNSGDSDGWGVGVIGVGAGSVAYYVWVTDVSQPTAAHIHTGYAGVNGGIVVDFAAEFSAVGGGSYIAFGSVAADAGTIASILENPSAFYFNVHNPDHAAGAVRGQVLSGGASSLALAASLNGERAVETTGDPDGEGFASVIFDDGMAHFYFNVTDVASPTAAHIHRGTASENGSIVVDPSADFIGGVAVATVAVDDDLAREILARPDRFYFNVHNQEFAAGAVRGQLRATETVRVFPVITRTDAVGARWRTDLNVFNTNDVETTTYADWFPLNTVGLESAETTTSLTIGAGTTEIVDDAVANLFQADGNGALRLSSSEPFVAVAKVFNDQRDNPAVGGTFGLFVPPVDPSDIPGSGVMLLGSNRPVSSGDGFRTNVGYFNPNPFDVDVTLTAITAAGEVLGSDQMTVAPFANTVEAWFRLLPSLPSSQRTQDAFILLYTASAPVAFYLTPVDNVTNDGFYVVPSFAPVVPPPQAGNNPPNGTIIAPTGNVTIPEGEMVNFEGTAVDPDGDPMSYLWNFGDGITATALVPGNHVFSDAGTYTVRFTVTDDNGAADPTPDTRSITVQGGGDYATFTAVKNQIFSDSCALSGCHAGNFPTEGMNLSDSVAYANIVNVSSHERPSLDRIEPGDPNRSYLYLKVLGDPSISGSRMPYLGQKLRQDLIDLLRDWIERGAPND